MTARSCAWLRTAQTARTRAREKPAAATRSISNLDRDRLLHPPEPEGSHQDPGAEHDPAERVVEEDPHVRGVDDVHDHRQADRQEAEYDRAHAALGGERPHLAAETLAVDHGLGHRLEE